MISIFSVETFGRSWLMTFVTTACLQLGDEGQVWLLLSFKRNLMIAHKSFCVSRCCDI